MKGKFLALLALSWLVSASVFAGTSGTLKGHVSDTNGAGLVGATVTISSPNQLGGDKAQNTDADGDFHFPAIDPGFYVVRVELDGFATQERTEVQVRLDRTTDIQFELPLGEFEEQVIVTGEVGVIDPEQVSISQTFTEEYLQKSSIGSGSRSYQNVLFQTAGVSSSDAGQGNPHVMGSTYAENAWNVDGINTTDPVTATFSGNYSFDVIQEISFQTNGFEAEYGKATGGVINVITKSGGNDFSGSLDVRYYDESFFQNGDHFDKDASPQKNLDPSLTFGGPILQDNLWFFTAYNPSESDATAPGSPTTRTFNADQWLAKLSWQINSQWRAMFKANGDPTEIYNSSFSTSHLRPPESQSRQKQGGKLFQGELSGVLGSDFLWTGTVGVSRRSLESAPMSGNLELPGAQNITTSLYSGNYQNAQFSDRDRDYLASSLTYFADDLAGSHELKVGLSYDDEFFRSQNFTTGDYSFTRRNVLDRLDGEIQDIYRSFTYNPNRDVAEFDGKVLGAFVQDAWQARPNLTLKIGVRYDEAAFDDNLGTEIADLAKVQPRLGLAWDMTGDGKTIGRLSVGRFMHPSATTTSSFGQRGLNDLPTAVAYSCNYVRQQTFGLPSNYPASCQEFADILAGSGWDANIISDPFGYDPEGWVTFSVTGAGVPNVVDPGLRPAYQDSLILGVERQLWNRTSAEVSYVTKKTNDIFEDTCNGNLPTPSADADCDFYVMANLPGLERKYQGVILRIESRATDWLHLNSSITWSESKGNIESTQNQDASFDYYPDHYVNTYGFLSDQRDLRFKLNGFIDLPLDFTLGFDAAYSTGEVYNHTTAADSYSTTFLEPRGSFEGNDGYQLDIQVTKGFQINRVNLQLIGTVLNLFDTERPIDRCENDGGCGDAALYDPIDWQRPRRYQVGLRVEF